MSKDKISDYSATANSNTDIAGINIDEGCAPSGINNAIRTLMKQLKDFQQGTNSDPFNGPVNGTVGATTPASGAFTTLSASGNVTLGDASTDTLNVGNGGIVKDASGNVGIGTSSPVEQLTVASNIRGAIIYGNRSSASGVTAGGLGVSIDGTLQAQINSPASSSMGFLTGGTERARIDSSGNLLVGATSGIASARIFSVADSGSTSNPAGIFQANNSGNAIGTANKSGTSSYNAMVFTNNGATQSFVGSIQVNASTISYNTSSDYRLKENIAPMTGALAKVAALKPVTYTWKADGSDGQGFIAHELQAVVPECVTGEKDAVDEDGNPKYQGIDTSFLVATLTAAIQEQQAIITSLTARIEALENK